MSSAGMTRWWGPLFEADRTSRARRWQGYAVRMLFVLPFLVLFVLNWSSRLNQYEPLTVSEAAHIGESFFAGLMSVVLVAVFLIAPAATAGAVCLDKSRGMLAHMFVTDLTNREIILGKLAARLFPVWALLASVLPVAAVMTLLGGIDPMALTTLFLVAAGLAGLGCSLALMLSVWANKPHEVLTVIYGIWLIWLLSGPAYLLLYQLFGSVPNWLEWTNPFYLVLAAGGRRGTVSLVEPSLFCLTCGVLSVVCTLVAWMRVRVVGCRSAGVAVRRVGWIERGVEWSRGQSRRFMVPKLDADPVYWREWHRNRPSRWSRVIWGTYALISTGAGPGSRLSGNSRVTTRLGRPGGGRDLRVAHDHRPDLAEHERRVDPDRGTSAGKSGRLALYAVIDAVDSLGQVAGVVPPRAVADFLAGCRGDTLLVVSPGRCNSDLDHDRRHAPDSGSRSGACQSGPGAGDLAQEA